MGDGALNGHNRPHLIPELTDHHIEELVCSQGQVLAVSLDGMVYMWGTPGDQAHVALMDPSIIKTKPEKIATFSKKKKIHAIACGRKHYVLLLSGIYAPQCYVSKGLGVERLGVERTGKKEEDEKNCEEGGGDWNIPAPAQVPSHAARANCSTNAPSQYILLMHPHCIPYFFTLSIYHTTLPFQYTLLTFPLNIPA